MMSSVCGDSLLPQAKRELICSRRVAGLAASPSFPYQDVSNRVTPSTSDEAQVAEVCGLHVALIYTNVIGMLLSALHIVGFATVLYILEQDALQPFTAVSLHSGDDGTDGGRISRKADLRSGPGSAVAAFGMHRRCLNSSRSWSWASPSRVRAMTLLSEIMASEFQREFIALTVRRQVEIVVPSALDAALRLRVSLRLPAIRGSQFYARETNHALRCTIGQAVCLACCVQRPSQLSITTLRVNGLALWGESSTGSVEYARCVALAQWRLGWGVRPSCQASHCFAK